jgi:hypothetical protein
MSSWLKAGLIGAAILIVINLIGLIPLLGCVALPLQLLAYVVIGAMAASFMLPRREAGAAAGQGALAALLGGLVSGVFSLIVTAVRFAITGAASAASQIPPDLLDQLRDTGVDPDIFTGIAGALGVGTCCCALGIVLAAALGAIGGLLYAALKPE